MPVGITQDILSIVVKIAQRYAFFQLLLKDEVLILYGNFDDLFQGQDMATSFKQENTKRAPDGRQAWRCACLTNLSQSNAPDAESVLPETATNLSIVVFLADMDDAGSSSSNSLVRNPGKRCLGSRGATFLRVSSYTP